MEEECCYVSKSGLGESNSESPHKLCEELCQDNQAAPPFHSFWQSSLCTWLAPLIGPWDSSIFSPSTLQPRFLQEWILEDP